MNVNFTDNIDSTSSFSTDSYVQIQKADPTEFSTFSTDNFYTPFDTPFNKIQQMYGEQTKNQDKINSQKPVTVQLEDDEIRDVHIIEDEIPSTDLEQTAETPSTSSIENESARRYPERKRVKPKHL